QLVGDAAQLGQDRPAGRPGRVRGEHRPDGEAADGGGDLVGRYPAFGDQPGGLGEPAAPVGAQPAPPPGTVHLPGDVGPVEVRGRRGGTALSGTADAIRRRARRPRRGRSARPTAPARSARTVPPAPAGGTAARTPPGGAAYAVPVPAWRRGSRGAHRPPTPPA